MRFLKTLLPVIFLVSLSKTGLSQNTESECRDSLDQYREIAYKAIQHVDSLETNLDLRDSTIKYLKVENIDLRIDTAKCHNSNRELARVKLPRTRRLAAGGTIIGFLTGLIKPWKWF